MDRAQEILKFWFGGGSDRRRMWFRADKAFDQECADSFQADYERAARGEFDHWAGEQSGALALILLLDQIPRNIFRSDPRAFATDHKAVAIARRVVAAGMDRGLEPSERAFLYMPFEHSENPDDQRESMRLFEELAREYPEAGDYVDYARRHLEVITRFGRFPHRNAMLNRASTPQEAEYLSSGASPF